MPSQDPLLYSLPAGRQVPLSKGEKGVIICLIDVVQTALTQVYGFC